jgi:hypothetical protein
MAGPAATIAVAIIGNADKLNAALKDGAQGVDGFASNLGGLGGVLKGAAIVGGVTAVGAAVVDLTKAAADDAAEQARLEQAIQASGAAVGDWQAQTEAAIAAGQSLAFTDTQIRDAMVPLVGATGDVAEATDLLSTAQDIARLKNVDLATAAEAVAKAQDGNATALSRLVGVSSQGLTATEVLAEAQRRAAGQADTYASSTSGGLERMGIMFDEVGETVGSAFIPVLEEILPVLIPIIEQFAELVKDLLPVLIPLLKLAVIPLKILANVISTVLDVLGPLIDALSTAIDVIGEFIGSAQGAKAAGGGAKGAVSGFGATPVLVTVNTGADPDAVIRAVRRYAAANGGQMGQLRAWG